MLCNSFCSNVAKQVLRCFFYRFTVPLNRTGMTKSSLWGGGGVCTQARPEVNMHKRNHEKDSGNSIMNI